MASLLELRVSNLGVAWGGTLHDVVSVLESPHRAPRRRGTEDAVNVFPIAAETQDVNLRSKMSASSLAERVSALVNPPGAALSSFVGVPAWIGSDFQSADLIVIERFIEQNSLYRKVFGTRHRREDREGRPSGLIDRLDGVLTSIGPGAPWIDRFDPRSWGAKAKELTIGNIGGVLIPRDELERSDSEVVKTINQRWTGIREEQLEACAVRAVDRETLGVVAFVRPEHAPLALACLERGLINRLVVCQRGLQRLLDSIRPF